MDDATLKFLMTLTRLEKLGLSQRDVLVLYGVISNPNINGKHLSDSLGYKDRSAISTALLRLTGMGMIEDKRKRAGRTIPNMMVATQKGIDFWNEIKP